MKALEILNYYHNMCRSVYIAQGDEAFKKQANKINEAIAELEALQSTHEEELKKAYIDGSNSTNELIQSLYKQIEQLKDKQ